MRNSLNTKRRERQFKAYNKHLTYFLTSSWDLNRKSSESRMHIRSTEICGWKRIWNPKFSIQASYRAPERFQTKENVPKEVYRTLYLFCRRQESCHCRRFLEQFLSLFRGGLSQFWWNIFCFFIRLRWVLVTVFHWKRQIKFRALQLRGTPCQRVRLQDMFMVRYCVITQQNFTPAVFSCNSLKSFFFFGSTLGGSVSSCKEFQI